MSNIICKDAKSSTGFRNLKVLVQTKIIRRGKTNNHVKDGNEKNVISNSKNCFEKSDSNAYNLNVINNRTITTNPYEVQRLPTKKIKKSEEIQNEFVFSNPALDVNFQKPTLKTIEGDFEVIRKIGKPKKTQENGCFENPGLEIPASAIMIPFAPNIGLRVQFDTCAGNSENTNQLNYEKIVEPNDLSSKLEKELEYYENQWDNSINETKNARSTRDQENVAPRCLHKIRTGKVATSKRDLKKKTRRYIRQTSV